MSHDDDKLHRGLAHDLSVLVEGMTRRRMLGMLGSAALLPLVGCPSPSGGASDSGTLPDIGSLPRCLTIPTETDGPFPGDGTNGPNVLNLTGVVRSDIRASIGGATGVAAGVPLTVRLTLVNTAGSCAPLAGHAIYLWHCDRDGDYSMYTGAATAENYLRGVQETGIDGVATFTTIFPACYPGRWPHMHFEIYRSLTGALSAANQLHVSQLALPAAACDAVYATSGYESSISSFARVSLGSDGVFRDGSSLQVTSITGDPASGYVAELRVGVSA